MEEDLVQYLASAGYSVNFRTCHQDLKHLTVTKVLDVCAKERKSSRIAVVIVGTEQVAMLEEAKEILKGVINA
jgi:recombinational DNA repair protein RecR